MFEMENSEYDLLKFESFSYFSQDKNFEVKCPPFCSTGCTDDHSTLLLALLNCNDDIDNFQESASFKELLTVLDYFKQVSMKDILFVF